MSENEKYHFNKQFTINECEKDTINILLNNLEDNLDILTIHIFENTEIQLLENKFNNLPSCLKVINFVYFKDNCIINDPQTTLSDIKTFEKNGKFNLLFGIKLPFDCKVTLTYSNIIYNVKYSDKFDELELEFNGQTIKIKYISFVPLSFWFNRNAGLALPLIALQYTDVKINFDFTNLG